MSGAPPSVGAAVHGERQDGQEDARRIQDKGEGTCACPR